MVRICWLFSLVLLFPLVARGAHPLGVWLLLPQVTVPGTPVAELTIGGEAYLLLEGAHPQSPLDAFLWNPDGSLPLTAAPGDTFDSVDGLTVLRTAAGPLVFARGAFVIGGVSTKLAMWDGVDWSLPGGAVTGISVNAMAVRDTPTGEELWIGGNLQSVPGLPNFTQLAAFDGSTWVAPGPFVGFVDTLLMVPEGAPDGDVIYITGSITLAGTSPVSNIVRYDGVTWDGMAGGTIGTDLVASSIELVPGDREIWLTGNFVEVGGVPAERVARYRNGAWEALGTGLPLAGGKLLILPTAFGDWVYPEDLTLGFPFNSYAWDPQAQAWTGTPSSAAGAYSFESPSGLFPAGFYRDASPTARYEWCSEGREFIRTDVNDDGTFNIADVIRLLNYLFPPLDPLPPISCLQAADITADAEVDISDAIVGLEILFGGSSILILPPYPNCDFNFGTALVGTLTCADAPFCP